MRWILPILGLFLQFASVIGYIWALKKAKIKILAKYDFAGSISKKMASYRFFVASMILWLLGMLCLMAFAVIDRDPVLFFSVMFITVSLFMLFIRTRFFKK